MDINLVNRTDNVISLLELELKKCEKNIDGGICTIFLGGLIESLRNASIWRRDDLHKLLSDQKYLKLLVDNCDGLTFKKTLYGISLGWSPGLDVWVDFEYVKSSDIGSVYVETADGILSRVSFSTFDELYSMFGKMLVDAFICCRNYS